VEFACGKRIDGAKGAKELLAEGYRSVFLAPGLWKAVALPEGKGISGVLDSPPSSRC